MFDSILFNFGTGITGHAYSVVSAGLKKNCSKTFLSRSAANEYMYKLCRKYHLAVEAIYDDHHDKTYKCSKGVSFYIQRCR